MPVAPHSSASSPYFSAYARIAASTPSTWRRRDSDSVHSQKSSQASSRLGAGTLPRLTTRARRDRGASGAHPTSGRSAARGGPGGSRRRSRPARRRRRRAPRGGTGAFVRAPSAPLDRRPSKVPAERSDIRGGVKEHLLSASDRAALQSLIPLASGLGARTIFGLFFVGRRRARFSGFDSIAIVAVLVAVATTAYYCIALLHRDTAITNKELAETAVPLVVAAVLLILISIVARLQGATQRVAVLLPLVLVAVIAAIELASSGVAVEPTAAPVIALVILAAAAAFGALGTLVDARAPREARRAEHPRLALLAGRGSVAAEARLALALPRP